MSDTRTIDIEGAPTTVFLVGEGEGAKLHFQGKWGFAFWSSPNVDLVALSDQDLVQAYYDAAEAGKCSRSLTPTVALSGKQRLRAQSAVRTNKGYFDELAVQRKFLADFVANMSEGDLLYHRSIAGRLRALLFDRHHPVLLKAAEAVEHRLIVWGPSPAPPGPPEVIWRGEWAAWSRPAGPPSFWGQSYDILDYVDIEVGRIGGRAFTPRFVVLKTANRAGESHYDPKKPPALRDLDALRLASAPPGISEQQRLLFHFGKWGVEACSSVLGYVMSDEELAALQKRLGRGFP